MHSDCPNGFAVIEDSDPIDGQIDEVGLVASLAIKASHGNIVWRWPMANGRHECAQVSPASGD